MRLSILRHLNGSTINQVLAKVKSEAPQYWNTIKTTNKEALYKKVTNLNNWYTKLLRLDEVKLYQDRVVTLQERLLEAQDKRREIGRQLADIRKKSNQLQDEIHKVKRQENIEQFLNLMKEETELLRLEHEIARTFQEYDRTERELFTAFTNAVRDSHEKQRAQLEYTKYFGIILSIAGSFLAFCYTTLRKDDMKRFIENSIKKNPNSNSNLVELVKGETGKLSELINFNRNEVIHIIEAENEAQMKKVLYYVGASFLIFIILKAITSN